MEVTPAQWLIALIGFLGGGAVGAAITQSVTAFRARRQPIRYQLRTTTIFAGRPNDGFEAVTKLVVKQGGETFEYDNLHAVELTVENAGNTDFSDFKFGVNLPNHQSTVRAEVFPPDRHHDISLEGPAVPGQPEVLPQAIDITLTPFNRGDQYSVVFQISIVDQGDIAEPMSLSTPHPIRFVRVAGRSDLATAATIAAELTVPGFGPLLRLLGRP